MNRELSIDLIGKLGFCIPKSLFLIVVAGCLYLAQMLPILGLGLMLFGASLWSIVIINAAFVGTAVEATLGLVSRWWLLAPIIWFGGYGIYAIQQHRDLRALKTEISHSNAEVRIPFDPSSEQLVFNETQGSASFVNNFDVPVVFTRTDNKNGIHHRSHRLAKTEVCSAIRNARDRSGSRIYTLGILDYPSSRLDPHFCNISQLENPSLPVLTISTVETPFQYRSIGGRLTITTAVLPDGRQFILRTGRASIVPWFPMPVMGCGLAGGWVCFTGFKRDNFVPLQNENVLMRALGRRKVQPENRRAVDVATTMAIISENRRELAKPELTVLDRMIADVTIEADAAPFRSLTDQDELLRPRLPGIIDAIERAVREEKAWSNAQALFRLVKHLPPKAVEPYLPRLEAIRKKDSSFQYSSASAVEREALQKAQ